MLEILNQPTPAPGGGPSTPPRTPWDDEMEALAAALRARGRHVPDPRRLTLVRVPEAERVNGLPLYRAVLR